MTNLEVRIMSDKLEREERILFSLSCLVTHLKQTYSLRNNFNAGKLTEMAAFSGSIDRANSRLSFAYS